MMSTKLKKVVKELSQKTGMSYQAALRYIRKQQHNKTFMILDDLKGQNFKLDNLKDED